MLVITQLFCLTVVPISYVLHCTILVLDLCPGFYLCMTRHNKQDRKLLSFFLSFIPRWPRTHMEVLEVTVLHFLFPSTIFVFSRVRLKYSLPALWSSKFLKLAVVKSAQSLLNLEEAEEGASSPAAFQYFVAPCSGWWWALQPTLQSLLLWDQRGPNVQSHLQPDYHLFPAVVCKKERLAPDLPYRT